MAAVIDTSALNRQLERIGRDIAPTIETVLMDIAGQMESDAKRDAPWTDRTGNARRTMKGFVATEDDTSLLVGIAGYMSYSPDLELRYGRRYAILVPTLDRYSPDIMNTIAGAVMSLGGIEFE